MGIKDNFSQAVKELWKKDGQEGEPTQPGTKEPSELDKYLRDQNAAAQPESAQQTSGDGDMISGGVPLETPYFPNNNASEANKQPAGPTNAVNAQPEQAVNRNAMNAMGGMGSMGTPTNAAANTQAQQPADNGYNQNAVNRNFGQNTGNAGYNGNAGFNGNAGYNGGNVNGMNGMNGRFVPPPSGNGGAPAPMGNEAEETTVISKNTQIEGNIRSLANMTIDGNIKGNLETTRNVDMTGKIVGDIIANNAAMNSAAMQGNISLKGRMKMDRDTILIGDLSSQYADINGRIRGKLDIVGKAELKRDAIVFGDINASTIAVTDGAIIQGYVNTTFLSKDDSRNVFPDAISIEEQKQSAAANPAANQNMNNMGNAENTANPNT